MGYGAWSLNYLEAVKSTVEVHERLLFRVDANISVEEASLQVWVQQLKSDDSAKRREAARILAAMAPPSMEGLLPRFWDSPRFRMVAPRASQSLDTARR